MIAIELKFLKNFDSESFGLRMMKYISLMRGFVKELLKHSKSKIPLTPFIKGE